MVEFVVPYDHATPLFALQYAVEAQTVAERCLCIGLRRRSKDIQKVLVDIHDWMKQKLAHPAAVMGGLIPEFEKRRNQAIELAYGPKGAVGHLEGPTWERGPESHDRAEWSGGSIWINTLTNRFELDGLDSRTVGIEIRERLHDLIGAPPNQQLLIAQGHMMLDHMTLSEMGVASGEIMHLTLKFHSGSYHIPAEARLGGAFGSSGCVAKFDFEFDTAGWEVHANHPIWGHGYGGIQIDQDVTLKGLTKALVHYAIANRIPMPRDFSIGLRGWLGGPLSEDMTVGRCDHFTIFA